MTLYLTAVEKSTVTAVCCSKKKEVMQSDLNTHK